MVQSKTRKRISWKDICFVLLAFIIAFPHLMLARYAIPGADDFSSFNAVRIYRANHGVIASAMAYTRDVYMSWQGNYTGEFLMGVEPSVRESYTGIRIIMILGVILFVVSVIFLMYNICSGFFKMSRCKALSAGLLTEFILFNISLTGELFSWYTGAVIYLIPLVFMLFAMSFSIRSFLDGKKLYAVLAASFGFLGAGGSLEVVGFGCAAYLVLEVIYLANIGIKNLKRSVRRALFLGVPFIITVIGALINTAAPGNFARHDLIEEGGGLDVLPAFISSGYNLLTHIGGLLTAYLLPLVLLLIFFLCVCSESKAAVSGGALAAFTGGALFITMITIFPVILGYSGYNIDAYLSASRIIYTFDLSIVLCLLVLDMVFAFFVKELLRRNNIDARKQAFEVYILIAAVLILFSGNLLSNYQNGMSMKIIDDLKNERIQIASNQMTGIYNKINDAKDGADVILNEPELPGTVLYIPLYIPDANYFANAEVANYYDVNTFVIFWG